MLILVALCTLNPTIRRPMTLQHHNTTACLGSPPSEARLSRCCKHVRVVLYCRWPEALEYAASIFYLHMEVDAGASVPQCV